MRLEVRVSIYGEPVLLTATVPSPPSLFPIPVSSTKKSLFDNEDLFNTTSLRRSVLDYSFCFSVFVQENISSNIDKIMFFSGYFGKLGTVTNFL